ncbi:MAG: N-acetyltransferase, partial [Proteobacteria bacterium]|nr:N-acetyltransferase [Pseudomonadota bacterium]
MIEIPTLETERLILRAPKFEDLEPMEVFFADPVRMKFLGGPIKRGDVWRALL